MEMTKDERERLWSERIEITVGGVEISTHLITSRSSQKVETWADTVPALA